MILFSLTIGVWSLISTHSRHNSPIPILLLVLGFVFIANGHFIWHEMEGVLIPLGGFTIAEAHYINWKLNKVCGYTHKNKNRDEK